MPELEFHFCCLTSAGTTELTLSRFGFSPFPISLSLSYFSFHFWELSEQLLVYSDPNPSHPISSRLVLRIHFFLFFNKEMVWNPKQKGKGEHLGKQNTVS